MTTYRTQHYTVRSNRGKARIWIEGDKVLKANFSRGTMFNIKQVENGLILEISTDGRRKVSGKGDRPIIDICGKSTSPLSIGENVVITYGNGSIGIIREKV